MDITELIKVSATDFQRHPWELTRLKILSYFLSKGLSSQPLTIMDAGSGDAFLAKGMAEKYSMAKIYAADINYSDEILQIISKDKPANLFFCRTINEVPTNQRLNAVVIMDVLEHLEKPEELLQSINGLKSVNPETVFIITVPAFQNLFSNHDVSLGHFRRYNLRQIKSLLLSANMKIVYSGYAFGSLLPVRWLQVLLEKNQKTTSKASIEKWKGGHFLTGLINTFFWLEFKISWYLAIAGVKLPGLSCYCICHPYPS